MIYRRKFPKKAAADNMKRSQHKPSSFGQKHIHVAFSDYFHVITL